MSDADRIVVSLARAIYSQASLILLDDVISAVDALTTQHIIQHCFKSPLMANRTTIVVSHAVESLAPLADQALFLDNSRVVWQGIGPELLESPHMIHLMTEPSKVNEEGHLGILLKSCIRRGWMQSRHKTPNQLIIEEQQEKGDVNINHWQSLRMCVTYRFPSGHNKNNCIAPKDQPP